MTLLRETFSVDVTMASPTIQDSEHFAGHSLQLRCKRASSLWTYWLLSLFRLRPITSWNDKPAEILQEDWDRMRQVYNVPGQMPISMRNSLVPIWNHLSHVRFELFQIKKKKDKFLKTCWTGDIDAYTGGLAELPLQGALVRFLSFSLLFKWSGIYRTFVSEWNDGWKTLNLSL